MFNHHTLEIPVGNKKLILKTGKIARQANGAITLQCGDTFVLATACASPTASAEIDFLPLRVDYQEKFSAVGNSRRLHQARRSPCRTRNPHLQAHR